MRKFIFDRRFLIMVQRHARSYSALPRITFNNTATTAITNKI